MSNIREVAKKANVSITTVSRILSGDESFHTTKETKKAVFKAIKDLKYVPNRKTKLTNIGCILSITSEKYSDPFFTTILASCEEEALKHNLNVSQIKHFSELSNPLIFQEFINSDLKGLIIMEKIPSDTLDIIKKHIPYIIYVDYDESLEPVNTVGFDHRFADTSVFNYLIDCGYKRIAIISESSPIGDVDDSLRVLAYREVLRKNNIKFDDNLIRDCRCDVDECVKQTNELMKLKNPPDVIFAGSDTLASAVIGELNRLGYKCPKDVGVIGFNNLPISLHTNPRLTTVEIPMQEIGKKAIKRLVELMKGEDSYAEKLSLPTKLIIRDSTRRIK